MLDFFPASYWHDIQMRYFYCSFWGCHFVLSSLRVHFPQNIFFNETMYISICQDINICHMLRFKLIAFWESRCFSNIILCLSNCYCWQFLWVQVKKLNKLFLWKIAWDFLWKWWGTKSWLKMWAKVGRVQRRTLKDLQNAWRNIA